MTFERLLKNEAGKWVSSGETFKIPARTVMVAAGTIPNVMYEREYPGTFKMDKWNEFYKGFALRVNGTVESSSRKTRKSDSLPRTKRTEICFLLRR